MNFLSYRFQFFIKSIKFNKNYIISFIDSQRRILPLLNKYKLCLEFWFFIWIMFSNYINYKTFFIVALSSHIDLALSSVEHIMRDVNNGWMIRYMHANGASMFFIVVYCFVYFEVFIMDLTCNQGNCFGVLELLFLY